MSTLSSMPEEMNSVINNIRGDDYGAMNYKSYDDAGAAIQALINQQIKSVLDELEGEAEAFERTSKKRDGLTHFAVPLSTIQKIRSRYE